MPDQTLPETASALAPVATSEPSPANSHAVARCLDAWTRAFKTELAKSGSRVSATFSGADAYRNAMPQLFGYDNIRDFIACVAQGTILGAIDASRSTRLLYAAQVALSTYRSEPRPPKPAA
ncbi:MAG: hypothetical protein WAM85_03345 [Terracidiphilus sp.]